MRHDIVGVVLAGGESRRMGSDKALLDVEGSAMVERTAALLASLFFDSVLAVGPGRRYPAVSLPRVEDGRPGCGPLAGLEASLAWSSPRPILVVACDLPRVDSGVLERLLTGAQSVVDASGPFARLSQRDGRLQPLCGLYSAACGPILSTRLDQGQRAVLEAVGELDVDPVAFDDVQPDPFLNVNTPADYANAVGRVVVG